jgi:hypothetical protein
MIRAGRAVRRRDEGGRVEGEQVPTPSALLLRPLPAPAPDSLPYTLPHRLGGRATAQQIAMAAFAARKAADRLKELRALPDNKRCFDCESLGTTYYVPAFGVFVCTACSGFQCVDPAAEAPRAAPRPRADCQDAIGPAGARGGGRGGRGGARRGAPRARAPARSAARPPAGRGPTRARSPRPLLTPPPSPGPAPNSMQFGHRVKSVTLAEFKPEELDGMAAGGNQARAGRAAAARGTEGSRLDRPLRQRWRRLPPAAAAAALHSCGPVARAAAAACRAPSLHTPTHPPFGPWPPPPPCRPPPLRWPRTATWRATRPTAT